MKIGAYAVERDYSHYVARAADTVLAVIGTASKGPENEAVVITSTQDLINKFGTARETDYGLYAAQYFLSQSSKLYFVRVKISDRSSAKTTLVDSSAKELFSVETLEAGDFKYSLVVADNDEKYKLTLKDEGNNIIEEIGEYSYEEMLSGIKSKFIVITPIKDGEGNAVTNATIQLKAYPLSGGYIAESPATSDYTAAAEALRPESVDANLVAVPGQSDAGVISHMLTLAEQRGDCLYLIDPPKDLERDEVIAWHNGESEGIETKFNSSYGALYYNWVTIYDSVNKKDVKVPPSVVVASTYAYSDRTSEIWYAPAGLNRGLVKGALSATTKLSKSDVDLLCTGDNCVNSIYEDPQVGLVVWGQRTLARDNTALNRVNVRRLMNYLKRVITAACNSLTFEPNDRRTWNDFNLKVNPILNSIVTRRGLYEYRIIQGEGIVTDEDIDNYRMPCLIMIRPTKTAEEIPIYFTITSTGADFNEVLDNSGIVVE